MNRVLYLLLFLGFLQSCSDDGQHQPVEPSSSESKIHDSSAEVAGEKAGSKTTYKPEVKNTAPDQISEKTFFQRRPSLAAFGKITPLTASKIPVNRFNDNQLTNTHTHVWSDPTAKTAVTSMNRYYMLDFENDIFTNTDYYFTNGAQISYIHPGLQHIPLSRFFPDVGVAALNHYGIRLRQNMYTPINPEDSLIATEDRPFAGVLYVEYFKMSTSHLQQIRVTSSIQVGVVGKPSLASLFQQSMHELFPVGWEYQIKDDLLINVNFQIEKRIFRKKFQDFRVGATARLGTYQTEFEASAMYEAGFLPITFNPFPITKPGTSEHSEKQKKLLAWFFIDINGKYNLHEATLDGGLFNHESPHTIGRNNRNRALLQLNTGLAIAYKKSAVTLKIVYLSPELKSGYDHRWGAINFIQNF